MNKDQGGEDQRRSVPPWSNRIALTSNDKKMTFSRASLKSRPCFFKLMIILQRIVGEIHWKPVASPSPVFA
jgi:hypothetical protein